MMKYKVGDKVKIKGRIYGHEFNIGDVVRIEHVGSALYKAFLGHVWWWVDDEECEPV